VEAALILLMETGEVPEPERVKELMGVAKPSQTRGEPNIRVTRYQVGPFRIDPPLAIAPFRPECVASAFVGGWRR
jgi:hypothetical protein